jgi:hypothetical protein
MKKKRKKYQTVQPTPGPEKVIPITAGRVQVGDIVKRKPITFSDHDRKDAGWMLGRVIWIHPLGRFHVVEFGEGRQAVRESFMGVRK